MAPLCVRHRHCSVEDLEFWKGGELIVPISGNRELPMRKFNLIILKACS